MKRTAARMQIGVLVENRYLAQAQPAGLISALRAAGHEAACIDPQAAAYAFGDTRWTAGLDLVVARGRSYPLLCMLGLAQARGVRAINSRPAIDSVHNKADMAARLAEAGIPAPETFLGPVRELSEIIPPALYPVILKPVFGDNSRGLRLVRSSAELSALEWPEPVALAQRFIANDGYDLKLYGIGDRIWAVRKPSPVSLTPGGAARSKLKAELVPLTRELEDLGGRLGRLFGLDLYGVDCIESADGPLVIEVNEFPNYTGVPDADRQLADYVARAGKVKDLI